MTSTITTTAAAAAITTTTVPHFYLTLAIAVTMRATTMNTVKIGGHFTIFACTTAVGLIIRPIFVNIFSIATAKTTSLFTTAALVTVALHTFCPTVTTTAVTTGTKGASRNVASIFYWFLSSLVANFAVFWDKISAPFHLIRI